MKQQNNVTIGFANRGLVQKVDAAALEAGQYSYLLNMTSIQEGAISSRDASVDVAPGLATTIWLDSGDKRLHTIAKMRLAPADTSNPRYVGFGSKIHRMLPSGIGEYTSATSIATDSGGTDFLEENDRWSAAQYNSGAQSKPSIYFGSSRGNFRDDGALSRVTRWGVPRPPRACVATVGYQSALQIYYATSGGGSLTRTTVALVSSGSVPVNVIGTAGIYRVRYTVSAGVHPIANVVLNNGSTSIVPLVVTADPGSLTAGSFEAYFAGSPSYGTSYSQIIDRRGSSGGFVSETVGNFTSSPLNLGAGGKASAGFDSVDPISLSFYCDAPGLVQDMRIRIGVGESAVPALGATVDFYEHVITPSVTQEVTQSSTSPANNSTIYEAGQSQALDVGQGLVGDYFSQNDPTLGSIRPSQLPAARTSTEPVYVDVAIPKEQWAKAGRAGRPGFNWQNVTSLSIQARLANGDITTAFNIGIGGVFFLGGSGPDSTGPGAVPYDYLACYRNPQTSVLGPPSIAMIETLWVEPKRTGVVVSVKGFISGFAGQPEISGISGNGSLYLYRRGGAYLDGIYRLVKTAAVGSTTSDYIYIVDDVPDEQITFAEQIEFDNDGPVTSNLPVPIRGTIATYVTSPSGQPGDTRLTFTVTSGDTALLRPWSIVTLGTGDSEEQCVVARINSVSAGAMDLDLPTQREHAIGEPIEIVAVAMQPCGLACAAFDSIFLADDPNNPGTLYRSKAGQPENFPVIDAALRTLGRIQVSSPSEPIRGIAEFGGDLACLTSVTIKTVPVWNGVMKPPRDTPANKGCVDKRCWVKGTNSLYYLADDGIYEWQGGGIRKISEAITWIFNKKTVNGIPPLDYTTLQFCCMSFAQSSLHLAYRATDGLFYRVVYETLYERWFIYIISTGSGNVDAVTALFAENEPDNFMAGRKNTDTSGGQPVRYQLTKEYSAGTIGTSDGYPIASAPTGLLGTPVAWRLSTPTFTGDDPRTQKLITQSILELQNPDSDVTVDAYYNFSNVPSADTFTVPAEKGVCNVSGTTMTRTSGILLTAEMVGARVTFADATTRNIVGWTNSNTVTLSASSSQTASAFWITRRRRVPMPFGQISSTAAGTECYAIGFVLNGSGRIPTSLYSISLDFAPLAEIQRAKGYDWDDLGYPYDKRLQNLSIEYNMVGQDVVVSLDTISGVQGETQTQNVMVFTLGGVGTGRAKAVVPIRTEALVQLVCKMVRLRPSVATANFQIFDYDFEFEKYPADITLFTEPSDYGSPWLKYFDQLWLEVDTGGVEAAVNVFIDAGASPAQVLLVTSTANDRMRPFTLRSGLVGRMARLAVTVTAGGKFQLFKHNFIWTAADKGEVLHSFDWSDVGHPFDKRFYHVWLEYEVNETTSILLEGIGGVGGSQTTTAIATLSLTAGGRKKQQYQFPTNSIYKMVRLIPQTSNPTVTARIYKPEYKFEPLPADIVPYTEPTNEGSPFPKYWQQLLIDVDTGGVAGSVAIEVDGAVVQTVSVTTTALDRNRTINLNGGIIGRQARLLNTAGGGGKFQLFAQNFVTLPADKGPSLHTYDWQDVGHKWDKRFYYMTLEYEVLVDTTLEVSGRSGIGGSVSTTSIMTITLSAGGRKQQQFNFPDNSIYKLVRVAPTSGQAPTTARIYQPEFKFEAYPPDVVAYTEPEDSGTPYRKYYQQLALDVDTGGVAASVTVEIDGVAVQTLSVTTTALARNVQLTLLPSLEGRKARLRNAAGSGGKFQLFSHSFAVLPADRGPVSQTFDWDLLDHPYSKRLKSVTFEHEISTATAEMILDIIDGKDGTTTLLDYARFTLTGTTRALQTFQIPDQTYATMIRFRPAATNVNFKTWRYIFDYEKLPTNTTLFTDYEDLGYPCEKILRSIIIDSDTGGFNVPVDIDIDGQVQHTFYLQTSATDRARVVSLPSDLIGFRFRLLPRPQAGAKCQLFKHQFDRVLEPCRVSHFDSYEQSFGSNGYKICKQIWLEYMSSCALIVSLYCDQGKLLWQVELPRHVTREVVRFFLPKASPDGVKNKSKVYRVTMDAVAPDGWFKLYRDSTRIETLNTGKDQRASFNQNYLWAQMPIPY